IEATPATKFRGEKQDLEEMIGNLVDNACKWAQSRVAIEVITGRAETAASQTLRLVVDDDGPGLTASQRERIQVPQRGNRPGEPGIPVGWRGDDGPKRYGTVVPGAPYSARGTRCRDYSHSIYVDGKPQIARGTACRNPDGSWWPIG